MTATVLVQEASGAGPTFTTVDPGTTFWGMDDVLGAIAIQVPPAARAGTVYSWLRYFALVVTGTSTTSISNRAIWWDTPPPQGVKLYMLPQATYTQNTGTTGRGAGNFPSSDLSIVGGVPSTSLGVYTLVTTNPTTWDLSSISTGSTGRNGLYVQCVLAVDSSCAIAQGALNFETMLPQLNFSYSEA